MKQRVRVQKAETAAAEQPVHRLTGMQVNEVSIVDRAANQRRYLVVKESKEAAAPPPPAAAAPPAAAPPPAAPPPAPAIQISPEFKAKVVTVLKAAQEKIAVIAKQLETATETPGAAPPQALMDQLTAIAAMFTASPAPAPVAPPPAAPPPAAKEDTEKAGKKISAARLAQLLSAQQTLASIISEVSDESAAETTETETSKEPAKEPAKKSDEPTVTPAPATDIDGIKAQIQSLADVVGKMTLVFESQNARLDAVSKARGESRQVDLDAVSKNKQQKIEWPMDMARPVKTVA